MSLNDRNLVSKVFTVLGLVCAAVLTFLAWQGCTYYILPIPERPLHPDHGMLRSSGVFGLPYGYIGFALIVLNLAYLLRRAAVRWERLGSLRSWMAMHVFTGLIGSLLILLHSAFLMRSAMATLASLSLWIVTFTGLVGRYIYAHVPRTLSGHEMEVAELERLIVERRRVLISRGVGVGVWPEPPEESARRGMVVALSAIVRGDRDARREFDEIQRAVAASPELAETAKEVLPLARRYIKEKQALARYEDLRDLMHVWRFFHRWFAIVMIAVSVCHILVASGLGGLTTDLP